MQGDEDGRGAEGREKDTRAIERWPSSGRGG